MSGTMEMAKVVFGLKRVFRLLRQRDGLLPWNETKDADIIAELATVLHPHVMESKK